MDENDESLVFVTFWDCRTHVPMTSSVERTDLDFKISVALVMAICYKRHIKVSKQRMLWHGPDHTTAKCFSSRNELQQEC